MESLKHVSSLAPAIVSCLAIGALKAIFSTVFTEEWKAWTPRLAQKMMRGAVKLLPPEKQERYLEEWTAALADTPGFLGKLWFALDLHRASFSISRQSDQAKARKVVTRDTEALRAIKSPAAHNTRQRETRKSAGNRPSPRVLIIDDERVIADTLAIILEHSGFSARAAYSGEQGIAVARDFEPQALVTDALIQGISGVETGIQVQSFLPECRVWIFAGQAASRDQLEQAAHAGYVFDVLDKPFHPSELLSQLQAVVPVDSGSPR